MLPIKDPNSSVTEPSSHMVTRSLPPNPAHRLRRCNALPNCGRVIPRMRLTSLGGFPGFPQMMRAMHVTAGSLVSAELLRAPEGGMPTFTSRALLQRLDDVFAHLFG